MVGDNQAVISFADISLDNFAGRYLRTGADFAGVGVHFKKVFPHSRTPFRVLRQKINRKAIPAAGSYYICAGGFLASAAMAKVAGLGKKTA